MNQIFNFAINRFRNDLFKTVVLSFAAAGASTAGSLAVKAAVEKYHERRRTTNIAVSEKVHNNDASNTTEEKK